MTTETPLDRFKAVLGGAARAIAREPEIELAFTADAPAQSGKHIKVPMPAIMGLDVAGEIAELGPGVTGWSKGDRVLVDPINRIEGGLMGETIHGGLAELCRARAHQLIKIPEGVSFSDAAALPVAYGTAIRMMRTNGHVAAGEKV